MSYAYQWNREECSLVYHCKKIVGEKWSVQPAESKEAHWCIALNIWWFQCHYIGNWIIEMVQEWIKHGKLLIVQRSVNCLKMLIRSHLFHDASQDNAIWQTCSSCSLSSIWLNNSTYTCSYIVEAFCTSTTVFLLPWQMLVWCDGRSLFIVRQNYYMTSIWL